MLKKFLFALFCILPTTLYAQQITGAGATFPYPVYSKWADEYKKVSNKEVNYQSVGSGAGIRQINAKTVIFGASDMPIKKEDLDKSGLVQFPTVIGAVVPVVNIPGIQAGQLVLSGDVLAKIYLKKITKWNDTAIASLNPDLKLPNSTITVVRRSDGSGTTFIFTNYLSKVSADWNKEVGEGTAVEWPVGIGAKGNEGVSANVQQTRNSIGYVEYAYAKQNNMVHARLINSSGKAIEPSIPSFQAAADLSVFNPETGFYAILTNSAQEQAWPIAGATFILMHKNSNDYNSAQEALKFFDWAFEHGDKLALDLDYVPLPSTLKSSIKSSWSLIK